MTLRMLYPIHIDRWRSPIATLLREIASRNPDLRFYSFSSPETPEDRELGKQFWRLAHVTKLKSPLEVIFRRFSVVHHASATPRNFLASVLAKRRGAVHVFTTNIEPNSWDKYLSWYERSVRACDVLVAVSHAVASAVERTYGRKPDAIIPNGVDLEFFSRARAKTRASAFGIRQPYVLFCAAIVPRKRPDILLNLAKRMPEVSFVMTGRTSKESVQYLELARRLPNVKYVAHVARETVRDFMAEAVALIFPSEVEGLPLTVLEALAMGLPVLAQPKSSLPEVVIPGKTGWLLSDSNLEEWEDALRQVMEWDMYKRQAFESEARRFVEEKFSWNIIAARYAHLYMEAVAERTS